MPSDHYDPQFSRGELFDIRVIPFLNNVLSAADERGFAHIEVGLLFKNLRNALSSSRLKILRECLDAAWALEIFSGSFDSGIRPPSG